MQFDLAFKCSKIYIDYVNRNKEIISSIYFGLGSLLGADARTLTPKVDLPELVEYLKMLDPSIKKYLTLNGRHQSKDKYSEKNLSMIGELLISMSRDGALDGVIFTNGYLIRALYKVKPELSQYIDLIPSINCFINSKQMVNRYISMMRLWSGTDSLPSKIILDRSLNRDMPKLKLLSEYIKKTYPGMKIEILVNEGCLADCPYKISHDIEISNAIDSSIERRTYEGSILSSHRDIRTDLLLCPCIETFNEDPSELIKSPFIRPDDIHYYEDLVDVFKISGKAFPISDIISMVEEYKQGFTNRNFVEIMDAPRGQDENITLHAGEFPKGFLDKVGYCDKNCSACGFCEEVFNKAGMLTKD